MSTQKLMDYTKTTRFKSSLFQPACLGPNFRTLLGVLVTMAIVIPAVLTLPLSSAAIRASPQVRTSLLSNGLVTLDPKLVGNLASEILSEITVLDDSIKLLLRNFARDWVRMMNQYHRAELKQFIKEVIKEAWSHTPTPPPTPTPTPTPTTTPTVTPTPTPSTKPTTTSPTPTPTPTVTPTPTLPTPTPTLPTPTSTPTPTKPTTTIRTVTLHPRPRKTTTTKKPNFASNSNPSLWLFTTTFAIVCILTSWNQSLHF